MARSRLSPDVTRDTIVLWCFLVAVALMGGGSRANIQSLVLLRPLSFLVLGYGCYRLSAQDVRAHRWILLLFCAAIVLVAIQLVPLPPLVWQSMAGRDLFVRIDRLAGLGDVWRPLSLAPDETWNALFSLAAPLAVVLLALRQSSTERHRTLYVMLAIGLVSGLIGLLQIVSPDDSPLYLYRSTDRGSGVGLFANRNHQGMFLACLFPMIAMAVAGRTKSRESSRFRHVAAWAVAVVLIPLILVTGSRSGLLLGVLGLLAAALALGGRTRGQRVDGRRVAIYAGGIGALIVIAAVTALSTKAIALDRLFASGIEGDLRPAIWKESLMMTRHYFPWGTGYGSFADIFRIDEPRDMLSPRFRNHVHNDPLEVAMTGGLAGLALLAGGVVLFLFGAYTAWRRWDADRDVVLLRRLGAIVLFMLALGSLVDYPLRVPLLSCFAACAAVWLGPRRAYRSEMQADGKDADRPRGTRGGPGVR